MRAAMRGSDRRDRGGGRDLVNRARASLLGLDDDRGLARAHIPDDIVYDGPCLPPAMSRSE